MLRLGSILVSLALLAGCGESTTAQPTPDGGGGDSGTTSAASVGATAAQAQSFCQAKCDMFQRCAGTGGATCVSSCVANGGNPATMRADALALGAACWQTVSCADPESCGDTVMSALDPDYQQDPVLLACIGKVDACNVMSNDNCADAMLATTATRAKLTACFAGSCGALAACFDAAFGRTAQ